MLAECDCCGVMVPRDEIGRVVAYGIEAYACAKCRGERQPPEAPTDAEVDRALLRMEHLFGKEWLEGGDVCGREWCSAQEFSIVMAWEAFRLAFDGRTERFPAADVLRWIDIVREHQGLPPIKSGASGMTGRTATDELVNALRSYQQADEEGVMVLVSRQACDEAADLIEQAAHLWHAPAYNYSGETDRLAVAQALYESYCQFLYTDPARAKTQMIAGIQLALRHAFEQGHARIMQEERGVNG